MFSNLHGNSELYEIIKKSCIISKYISLPAYVVYLTFSATVYGFQFSNWYVWEAEICLKLMGIFKTQNRYY